MRDLDALVAALDLDVNAIGICHACLSFVSSPLGDGDEREAKRQARTMTPWLWEEGLDKTALDAMRRACADGVAGAEPALGELERKGGRSAVARAIVLSLAADLAEDARIRMEELERLRSAAEWN
jgi:hypothetical protein